MMEIMEARRTGALPLERGVFEAVPEQWGTPYSERRTQCFPYLPAWKNSRNGSRKGRILE